MQTFEYEYTDTFAGESNYCWVKRGNVSVPDLVHYGYTGLTDGSYGRANTAQRKQLMKLVKREVGLTGVGGVTDEYGFCDRITFKPYRMNTVLFISLLATNQPFSLIT